MADIKLLALDLDGTLFNSKKLLHVKISLRSELHVTKVSRLLSQQDVH